MNLHLIIVIWHLENSYVGSILNPFQGIYKGNEVGTGLWPYTCSQLVEYLRKEGQILETKNNISAEMQKLSALILIDYNSTLIEGRKEEEARTNIQATANT